MQNRQMIKARKYLCCFDEILNQMSEKMLSPEITNNITINFIQSMILHHQTGIDLSKNLLEYTSYHPLQEMAKNRIVKQTKAMEEMTEIARTTYGQNMPQDVNSYMEKYFEITKNMIDKMKNAPRWIFINLDFTYEMIPHQEGAIAMCQNLLQYRMDPRLKAIADSMIEEQTKEIQQLMIWQRKLRGN
ncbi:MAG: DUF305 domain-containing protein [Clostridia bacterium]|nr:DUF305 domain-containing protein [Clostridia bacterium]